MYESLSLHDGTSISSRQVSGFPISLGSGLALESIFPRRIEAYDSDRKIPNQINVADYQECWISLSTLFRNMVSSMNKEVTLTTTEKEYADAIETEIDVINGLFMNEGRNLCKPIFYYCTYKSLITRPPQHVLMRTDKTESQKFYTFKHDKVMKLLTKTNDSVREFDSEIKPLAKPSALILTHHPWDLLSYKNFGKLDLLESNTGRLKSRYLWNTKYYPVGDSDLSSIPFTRKLLYVFGDRVQIHPSDMKLRRLIVETAQKHKWTALHGDAKIMMDLEMEIREPFVIQFLRSL